MKYLLDTNVISELVKPRLHPKVANWVLLNEPLCALAAVTVAEIVRGIEKLGPSRRKEQLLEYLQELRNDYAGRILPFDEAAALSWGRYVADQERRSRPVATHDSYIAAIALANDMTVVTNNVADFPNVSTFNPFAD